MGSGLLGTIFIILMPPGLPYDEPSHWANVLFYVEQTRMPRLGEPGVSYEAQQGPAAYVLDALVAAPLRLLSDSVAFYAVRVLGLIEHLVLTWLIWRVASRVLPSRPEASMIAAAVVGLNPMLLAMSTSVQNDTLSLALAVAAIELGMRPDLTLRRAALTGVLTGLALLAKIIVWPIAVVLGLWILWKGRLKLTVAYGVPVAALISWWIVRNYSLYGDATGQAGVAAAGYRFPALTGFDPVSLVKNVLTYLWLPSEYVRNTVTPPVAVIALVGIATIAGCVGAAMLVAHRRTVRFDIVLALAAMAVLAVGAWLMAVLTSQAVSFRFAYASLPLWFMAIAGLTYAVRVKWVAAAFSAGLVGISSWFLAAVVMLPNFPFEIPL